MTKIFRGQRREDKKEVVKYSYSFPIVRKREVMEKEVI
jgi:hypothetical protein